MLGSRSGEKKRPLKHGRKSGTMTNKRRTSRLQQQIDDNLRRVYSDTVQEPLPDRFTQLLDKLRAQESEDPQDNSKQSSKDDS
ncbi:NepR family anti-sigma factor [uncultured Roseovarius sp.]|uniref:NepR family anti-sigma factor n=1 Tax=uncultured Roseovarius sp. TaxID=293344 RepID=UPI0026252A65|nr:NepR family anti-sigma factor [uncultured Roseovarius sp.]